MFPKDTLKNSVNALLTLHSKGRFEEMSAQAKTLLQKFPDNFLIVNLNGISAANTGNLKLAKKHFRRAVEIEPKSADALINLAETLHRLDDSNSAVCVFEKALLISPNNSVAHNGMGIALRKLGRLKEAEEVLKTGALIAPNNVNILYNLANIQFDMGDFKKAELSFKKAIKIEPDFFEAHNNLGLVFTQQKEYHQAASAYRKASELRPGEHRTFHNLASSYQNLDDHNAAYDALNKSLSIKPEQTHAYLELAKLLIEKKQSLESIQTLRMGLRFNPNSSELYNAFGSVLLQRRKYKFALAAFEKAIGINPQNALFYNNMGMALFELGSLDRALKTLQKATKVDPKFARALFNRGLIYQFKGRFKEAKKAYFETILIEPEYASAHRNLVTLTNSIISDSHIQQMIKILNGSEISAGRKCELFFALAQACEKNNELGQAFKYYEKGNKLRKKILNYHFSTEKRMLESIVHEAPRYGKIRITIKKRSPKIPIFILGMPRAGSTLVENILSRHSQVFAAGELPKFSELGFELFTGNHVDEMRVQKVRQEYLKHIATLSKKHVFITDKLPHNFLHVGLIRAALPEAKIIHTKRNGAAVCWSNYKQYFAEKAYGYSCDLEDVEKYYDIYTQLMAFWHSEFSDHIYTLSYEDLVAAPEENIAKLLGFIGLNWESECLSPEKNMRVVKTASDHQSREKIYKGSSDEWQKFAPWLGQRLQKFKQDNK